ncbi:MAG TPA: serine/threonine-protein kinase, partial [Gemmatirosa sp.]
MRSVGVGGFARVYHAVDPDLELDVAIKVLRPELAHDAEIVERFRREATTVARLRHPHVITVLTVGRLADPFDGLPVGAPYLVMDYLPHSLADRLNEGGALPQDDVARIGAEVARGLAYAHRQGIVHRDVKPENVLFARDGRAVVTDFGIARALSAAPSGPSRQVLLGTPAYFSPEQARGLALDGRSDLYSHAVTLYRAATGVVPFAGDDWYVVMRQHVEETAVPPS